MSLFGVVLAAALAVASPEVVLSAEQEALALRVGRNLRCAVCQGMSVADSPSATARSQFQTVRELVAEGKGEEEIRAFFVSRYGEWALLEPKAEGVVWVAWLGPLVFLLLGLFGVGWAVLRAPAGPGVAATEEEVES